MNLHPDHGTKRAIQDFSPSLGCAAEAEGHPGSYETRSAIRRDHRPLFDPIGIRRDWADFRRMSDIRAEIREKRLTRAIRVAARSRRSRLRELFPARFPEGPRI